MRNHRDRKYLNLAHRVNHCQFNLPDTCEIYSPDGCEPAHSNNQIDGKGMGIKADDYKHVAACHSCHFEYDHGNRFDRETKREAFRAGWERTLELYFKNKWIKAV